MFVVRESKFQKWNTILNYTILLFMILFLHLLFRLKVSVLSDFGYSMRATRRAELILTVCRYQRQKDSKNSERGGRVMNVSLECSGT